MDTEKIIKEWFYRLPKGYAEAPYSTHELNVLDEVMSEFGVPATNVDMIIEASGDKADIKDLIANTEFTDEELDELKSFIVSIGYRKTLIPYLTSKGMVPSAYQLGNRAVKVIFNRIAQLPNVVDVLKYFESPPNLTISSTPFKGNIVDQSGLSAETISELMQIQPGADSGGNSTGPAEIALALLFANVTNKQGGGDLEVDGRTLEVKGKEARLGSQARGKKSLESSFIGYLLYLINQNGKISDEDYDQFMDDTDHTNIAIAIRDFYELLSNAGSDESFIVENIQKGIAGIFFENKSVTTKYINSNTDFTDANKIMKQMVKINLEAYMEKIKVDSILFHLYRPNKQNFDFVIIDKVDIETAVEDGTIRLGSKKKEGSFFWHDTNPGVVLSL